jgi:hypothetical protein
MKPFKAFFHSSIVLTFLMVNSSAFAVGTVSRACAFSKIPTGLKTVAANFFVKLGADENILNLPNAPIDIQNRYYVLESLTTDYGFARYYLFAASGVYGPTSFGANTNKLLAAYKTEWTSEQVSEAIRNDPYISPYYVNREYLFSARAGYDKIIQRWYWLDGVDSANRFPINFKVRGWHSYYDPVTKTVVNLPSTTATDCNLSNLGIGIFDR